VIAVQEDIVLHLGGRQQRVVGVDHERCDHCGERIFGVDASRKLDALIMSRRRVAAA